MVLKFEPVNYGGYFGGADLEVRQHIGRGLENQTAILQYTKQYIRINWESPVTG